MLILGAAAVTVQAATVEAEGGVWNYGVGSTYVWSYYSHNGRNHASTAKGKYTSYSGKMPPGVQARASAAKSWSVNKTYYSVIK